MNFKGIIVIVLIAISFIFYSCQSNDGLIVTGNPSVTTSNKALIQLFTNTSCIPCVSANTYLNGINNLNGTTSNDTNIILLRVHTTLFANDPYYNFNPAVNYAMQQYYNAGISNPRGYLMGVYMGSYNASS